MDAEYYYGSRTARTQAPHDLVYVATIPSFMTRIVVSSNVCSFPILDCRGIYGSKF